MTDSAKRAAGVLKIDARGRVRSTPAQRQAVLEEFERSGLSGPQFTRVAGIAYQTFAAWRRRHKHSGQSAAMAVTTGSTSAMARPVRLVEAVMTASTMSSNPVAQGSLRVDLPGGVSVVIVNATQVPLAAQLIKAIAGPC